MNVFNIIGPVMIGPSSSHTAGAVRLGRVANKLTDNKPLKRVEITLSGSFAQTYKGHGTDRALLAGIMGYHSYSAEIRDALEIAKQRGIEYTFLKEDIKGAHPNTARIHFILEDGEEGTVQGASIGGGNILVSQVNGMNVEFNGENNTILVMHQDKPGVIAAVTQLMHFEYADHNYARKSQLMGQQSGLPARCHRLGRRPGQYLGFPVQNGQIGRLHIPDHLSFAGCIRRPDHHGIRARGWP